MKLEAYLKNGEDMKKKYLLFIACLSSLFYVHSAAQLEPRDLTPEEVSIQKLNTNGSICCSAMVAEEFDMHKNSDSLEYRPETDGYFGTEKAVSDATREFSVYYKEGLNTKNNQKVLIVGLHGFTGTSQDLGVYASKLLPESENTSVDILLIGPAWDETPHLQNKPGGNLEGGSIGRWFNGTMQAKTIGFFASLKTITYGGPVTRIVKEPISDINKVLDGEISLTDATTGKIVTVTPQKYTTWILVGQCHGGLLGWELQLDRAKSHKRLFDGFIVDGTPDKTIMYSPLPILETLKETGHPALNLVLRGGKDAQCSCEGTEKILKQSAPGSIVVTAAPYDHISTMYNGRGDEQKIYKGRDVVGSLMRKFVDQTITSK